MIARKPLVSLGMPVHNEARWIEQALDALLGQTFTDFELIASDNNSTDTTWEILQQYANRDERIQLYRQPEKYSAIKNFEFVLEQASGEYFMWVAGHDSWAVNLLELLVAELRANPETVLCVPHSVLIDGTNRLIESFDEIFDTRAAKSAAGRILRMEQRMRRSNAIYGLHRRHILKQTFPWPQVIGSDFIALIRIAALGDIVTQPSAQWFRRKNHEETASELIQRRLKALGVAGFFAQQFPFFTRKCLIMLEVSKAKGSLSERLTLFSYNFNKSFLRSGWPQRLAKELVAGSIGAIRSVLLKS